MTLVEVAVWVLDFIVTNVPFFILYVIIGFGPGFVFGIIVANFIFGRGPTYLQTHEENIRQAGEHNAQWHPDHDRWKKQ